MVAMKVSPHPMISPQGYDPSTLVAVRKSGDRRALLVVFNSMAHRAFADQRKPFGCSLECFESLSHLSSEVIWFVEASRNWYTDHEARIVEFLRNYIVENDAKRVVLFGMSSGGFAAARLGVRLASVEEITTSTEIVTFSLNMQSGFRPELLGKIRQALVDQGRDVELLGKNPAIFDVGKFNAKLCGTSECDVSELAKACRPSTGSFHVLYDSTNPIERVFAEDLAGLDRFRLEGFPLGHQHAQGLASLWERLWKSGELTKSLGASGSEVVKTGLVDFFHPSEGPGVPPSGIGDAAIILRPDHTTQMQNVRAFSKFGMGVLVNNARDKTLEECAEFGFFAEKGAYSVGVEFSCAEIRPVKVVLDDNCLSEEACNVSTGGWSAAHRQWSLVGDVEFERSESHRLRLSRVGWFPHIRKLALFSAS